jgi:AraC-like DNA-binding protein
VNNSPALFILQLMVFEFGFYSSLLLIFFVHGLVYAFLLYRKGIRKESTADKWLSLFLLLCILYIAPWMVGFGGWYDNQPYRDVLFYTPFQHLFFIGPVMFFYVQNLLNPSFRFGKKEWLHLLPGILYLLFSLVMLITDKVILKKYYFLAAETDPDFDTWYQYSGFASMLFYFLLSLRYYSIYKKMIVQVVSYADAVLFRWVKNFLLAFLLMLILKLIFVLAMYIPAFEKMVYTGPWWEYFSFSIVFYYIAITGYSNSIQTKVSFKLNLLNYKQAILLPLPRLISNNGFIEEADIITIDIEAETIKEKQDSSNTLSEWKPKILQLVQVQKLYEDPELSLTQIAKLLNSNPSIISKAINQGFGLNFNDFINHYRIEAVKEKLQAGEQKTQTLLGIAYDCGFNSKATFNRAFKKATGQSPKEWMEMQDKK